MTVLCRFLMRPKSASITGLAIDYPRPSAAPTASGRCGELRDHPSSVACGTAECIGDGWLRTLLNVGLCVGEVEISYREGGQGWVVKSKLP
jgi:hypothetical protein